MTRLRAVFAGQPTGLLDRVDGHGLAHHSFHVFVVYPWIRLLQPGPGHTAADSAGLPDPLGHGRFQSTTSTLCCSRGRSDSTATACTLAIENLRRFAGAATNVALAPPPSKGRHRCSTLGLDLRTTR